MTSSNSRGEATRQRILQASAKAFASFGYAGTGLNPIASELGITRQALLFHFKDKLGLYDATVEWLLSSAEQVADIRSRQDFDSLQQFVVYLVSSTVEFHFNHPEFSRMANHFLLTPAPSTEDASPAMSTMVEQWYCVLEEGRSTGLTRDVPLPHLIALIGGMLSYSSLLPQGRQASGVLQQYATSSSSREQLTQDLLLAVNGMLGLAPGPA